MNYPPDTKSLVHVTFRDTGEVRTYPLSASYTIGRYLATDLGQNNVLCLMCGGRTTTIMGDLIREFVLEDYRPTPTTPTEKTENE